MNKDDLAAKLAKATLDDMARPMSNKDDVAGLVELKKLQKDAGIPHLPTQVTYQLRRAVAGYGTLAYQWADKPHRLVYDACREIEAQADALTTLSAKCDDLQRRLDNICMNIHTCFGDSCERPVCVERRKGDKLREALHFYADYHPQPSEGPWGADSRDFGDIARQALAGDTNHG